MGKVEAIEEFSFVGLVKKKLKQIGDDIVKFNSSICLTSTRRRGNDADVPVGLFLEF